MHLILFFLAILNGNKTEEEELNDFKFNHLKKKNFSSGKLLLKLLDP